MAETKSTETKGAETKTSTTPVDRATATSPRTGNLAPAAESSDPEVHQLLAQRQAHVMNAGLDEDPELEGARKAAKAEIDRIDEKLAELGVTAK